MAFFGQQSPTLPRVFLATADQSFTSATFTDSTYLQANLLANTKYQITIGLMVLAPDLFGAQTLKAKWSQTSGTVIGGWIGIGSSLSYQSSLRTIAYNSNVNADTPTFLTLDMATQGQVDVSYKIPVTSFIASVGATGGISKAQFANTDPDLNDLYIQTNSYMIVTQLA
jgi:hypothetical protein